jgi:hypothetical protein
VECGVWLKIAAQFGPNAPVHCREEFAMQQTAIFVVVYSELHHGDISVLFSKNSGLHFGLMEHIHGAHYFPNTVWIIFDQVPWFIDALGITLAAHVF